MGQRSSPYASMVWDEVVLVVKRMRCVSGFGDILVRCDPSRQCRIVWIKNFHWGEKCPLKNVRLSELVTYPICANYSNISSLESEEMPSASSNFKCLLKEASVMKLVSCHISLQKKGK
ncbi:hypothetical protein Tco_0840772 [Tanacetum coccineum]|uniref:Uncharacterized protein n=1 Tax=Tanacetum coccineum TaxID=301880 RepID=A0ABQ5AUK2_9ASTR